MRRARTSALQWRRTIAVLLRVLAVLLSFQLSGLVHAIDDLAHRVFTDHAVIEHRDCDDESSHDCPPGAADCHHPHSNAVPPGALAELLAALTWLAPSERLALAHDDSHPPLVDLPTLDRPPRALAV